MTEIDTQAFLTGEHEVVTQMRLAVTRAVTDAFPDLADAVDFVLAHLANVSYRGDAVAYVAEARPVISAALTLTIQPMLDRARHEHDANEADIKRKQEEFEFLLLETPEWLQ